MKGAQGDVLLVGGPPGGRPQALARAGHQQAEVAFPENLDSAMVAGFEQVQPGGVRVFGWHKTTFVGKK
jgi:hypothetical protein